MSNPFVWVSFVVAAGCAAAQAQPEARVVTLAAVERAPEAAPHTPADPEVGLRVVMGDDAALFADGHRLTIGDSERETREVLGSPTWKQENPVNETAMSDTTYLFYSGRGLSIRIKHGKVEGFYVSLEPTNIDGHGALPAHPVLPHELPLDATVEQVVAALGEPVKRQVFAPMDWLDLHYRVRDVLVEFHYEHLKFVSVTLELSSLEE